MAKATCASGTGESPSAAASTHRGTAEEREVRCSSGGRGIERDAKDGLQGRERHACLGREPDARRSRHSGERNAQRRERSVCNSYVLTSSKGYQLKLQSRERCVCNRYVPTSRKGIDITAVSCLWKRLAAETSQQRVECLRQLCVLTNSKG